MSFTYEESEIIRDADMDGSLKLTESDMYVIQLIDQAYDLQNFMSSPDVETIIGDIGISIILLCAKLDLDLTTCIRKARKQ